MKIFILTLFLLLATFSNVYSQDFWEKTNGLDNLTIYSLAVNSSGDIFAGTDTTHVVIIDLQITGLIGQIWDLII